MRHNTDSMNNTVARMHSLLTGVRRSMGCWRLEDATSPPILMVMFSVELLDEICGGIQKTKVLKCYLQVITNLLLAYDIVRSFLEYITWFWLTLQVSELSLL